MRSMFMSAQFQRFDLGKHALSQAVVMGPQSAFALNDILGKVGLDPSDIDKIEDPAVRADLKASYQRCVDKGLDSIGGITCLAELGAKVYAKLNEQKAAPPIQYQPVQPASTFPWIPVTIGLVAAAGLVYFLATKGK